MRQPAMSREVQGEAPADADAWKGVPDKFEQHFSPEPGKKPD